tara:strand:- start:1681 stop:2541 length:861 start_codon:yes stop_codon:yes gene_type:complete
MGLLDKVDNLDETEPAKAVAKKAVAKKASPKVSAKALPKKAVAKKAVAKKTTPKAAKTREKKISPQGMPEGFELAGSMPRYIGWLINFAWNFGVVIGLLSVIATGSIADLTIPWLGAGLMIIVNWLVMPIWTGRNIGEFVSRSKYINSSGAKPMAIHAILNNSLGFMSLAGVILMFINFQDLSTDGLVPFLIGIFMVILWVLNFFFKKNSDYSQGIFDLAFSTYLVKHVATGSETGWMARFEGLGDFGDKWQERQQSRAEKSALKAEEREKKESESESANTESSED